jgi:hypothetical protein
MVTLLGTSGSRGLREIDRSVLIVMAHSSFGSLISLMALHNYMMSPTPSHSTLSYSSFIIRQVIVLDSNFAKSMLNRLVPETGRT